MANTIITLKSSGVSGNVPSSLQSGELAINYADGKLFYGDSSNTAVLFDVITEPAGLNGEVQFNDSGSFGSSSGFTYNQLTEALTVTLLNVDSDAQIDGDTTSNTFISSKLALAKPEPGNYTGERIRLYDFNSPSKVNYSIGVETSAIWNAVDTNLEGQGFKWYGANTEIARLSATGNLKTSGVVTSQGFVANTFIEFPDGTRQFSSADIVGNYANSAYDHANSSYLHANSAYDFANTRVSDSGDTMTGDYFINGNLTATYVEVETELFAGIATSQATLLPNIIAQFTSNSETYTQVNQQNINPNGSADYVVTADVGDDDTFYVDMGIKGSGYSYSGAPVHYPLDSYLIAKGSNIGQPGGNLVIGTITSSYDTEIKFIVGGEYTENVVSSIDKSGMYVNGQFTSETTNTIASYANSSFGAANVADQKAVSAGSYANSAYTQANTGTQYALSAGSYANSAYLQANTGTQYALSAGSYANSAYTQANTATTNAAQADQRAVTSGDYANSAFALANTANVHSISAYNQANTATTNAATADQKAVSAGSFANSAFDTANTAITNASIADQRAVTSGDYANSAYTQANTATTNAATVQSHADSAYDQANTATTNAATADQRAVTSGDYANSAYTQANTATTNASIAQSHADSAYNQANTATTNAATADQKAVSAGSYANSSFNTANTAITNASIADQKAVSAGSYANSAFLTANSKVSKSGDTMTGQLIITVEDAPFIVANTTLVANLNADLLDGLDSTAFANADFANTVNTQSLTTGVYANAAFDQANTATTDAAVADQRAVTSGDYANSAFTAANTADQKAVTSGSYANSAFIQSNTATTDAATADLKAVIAGSYANSAFNQANTATTNALNAQTHADSAYDQANTSTTNAATADQKAVTSGVYANAAYTQANTATTNASIADQKAVSAGSYANSSFSVANTANQRAVTSGVYANAAYTQANTATTNAATADQKAVSAGVYANSAFATANSKVSKSGDTMTGQLIITVADAPFIVANNTLVANLNSDLLDGLDSTSFANASFANIVSASATTTGVYANAAYTQANTATTTAQSAYDQANTSTTNAATADQKAVSAGSYANSAFVRANSVQTHATSAYNQANTATTNAATADQKAVSAGSYANSAYNQANTATTNAATADQKAVSAGSYANSAYAFANTRYASTGGTIDGDVTITGNLNITGNVVSHGSDDLIIDDPIVLLANNNTSNTIDIGWSGTYRDNGTDKHLGVISHAATNTFYVFNNYEPSFLDSNILDINDASFRVANLTANLITDVVQVRGYDPIDHANAAFSIANSAASLANTKVSKSGDVMTGSLTGVTTLGVNVITLEQSQITTNTFTTSSTSQVSVDEFSSTAYRSAKYYVQMTSGSAYHVIELSLLHDGSTVNLVQYGEIRTGASLGTFDASITTGTLSLLFTPTNATTTVKLTRTTIEV